jgi:hypothetical protein
LYYQLLQLSGCALLGAGLWLRLAYNGYAALLPQYSMLSADSLCIAVGVTMFVVAFFGCCGAWFQNRCMLVTVSRKSIYHQVPHCHLFHIFMYYYFFFFK